MTKNSKSHRNSAGRAPIKFVENTGNTKLVGTKPVQYTAATTYSWVGPTCPTSCWFHPESVHRSRWPEGFRACYATKGHTAFQTNANVFAESEYDASGLAVVRARIEGMILKHRAQDIVVDVFRWHTGGDILVPNEDRVWDAHVDLILWAAEECRINGIPFIGYTAAWRYPGAERLKDVFLASVQDEESAVEALNAGWTVAYGVLKEDAEAAVEWLRARGHKATMCPELAGKAKSCAECGLCAALDTERMHQHKLARYMLYRRKSKSVAPEVMIVFPIHN